MSAPVPSPRRFAIAVGAATAATTVAIGVTAASLLGWFRPAPAPAPASPSADTPTSAPPSVVEPTGDVQLAMHDDDDDEDEDEDEDDDDDDDEDSDDEHADD